MKNMAAFLILSLLSVSIPLYAIEINPTQQQIQESIKKGKENAANPAREIANSFGLTFRPCD